MVVWAGQLATAQLGRLRRSRRAAGILPGWSEAMSGKFGLGLRLIERAKHRTENDVQYQRHHRSHESERHAKEPGDKATFDIVHLSVFSIGL